MRRDCCTCLIHPQCAFSKISGREAERSPHCLVRLWSWHIPIFKTEKSNGGYAQEEESSQGSEEVRGRAGRTVRLLLLWSLLKPRGSTGLHIKRPQHALRPLLSM